MGSVGRRVRKGMKGMKGNGGQGMSDEAGARALEREVSLVCNLDGPECRRFQDIVNDAGTPSSQAELAERILSALEQVLPDEPVREKAAGHVIGVMVQDPVVERWEYK